MVLSGGTIPDPTAVVLPGGIVLDPTAKVLSIPAYSCMDYQEVHNAYLYTLGLLVEGQSSSTLQLQCTVPLPRFNDGVHCLPQVPLCSNLDGHTPLSSAQLECDKE